MKPSLGLLLAVCLAGLQFVAVLAVVSSSYVTSEQALVRHARDLVRDVGINTIEHARGFLRPAEGAAELAARLAQNRVIASDDPVLLEQLLFQQLLIAPQFAGLYYGSANGDFVMVMRVADGPGPFRSKVITHADDQRRVELIWRDRDFRETSRQVDTEDSYDPRTRPWYKMASETGTTIWTAPYMFFSSQQPGITLAAPVIDRDAPTDRPRVRGVVGVDIEISRISDFLARLNIGEHGRAMVIHSNGDVIAYPKADLLKTQDAEGTPHFATIAEIKDPVARAAFAGLLVNGEMQVEKERPSQFTLDGAGYVATAMPLGSEILPWTIAVYAPEEDFTGVIKANRAENIWIAGIVAAISGFGGLVLAHYIHKPVRAFAIRSALISQGELDPTAPTPRTYRELERANDALMQQIAARREAEHEYGKTFELSSLGMARLAADCSVFLLVNPRFCEITGYDSDELLRMSPSDLAWSGQDVIWPIARDGERDFTVHRDMRLLRKDGQPIWVSVSGNLIRDTNGKVLHVMLTLDDITTSREKEARIDQLNRDLSHLARGNTMGQMASGLAHELNQPLTAIAQNADTALLILDQQTAPDSELREILLEIERQSLRAGDIIHALRAFIRKDEGGRVTFEIAELLDQTMYLVHAETVDSGVVIERLVEPGLPPVLANRVQVAQVLVNLLRNSIEAMAEDRTNERRVTLSARTGDGQVIVTVADTGPGLDPAITPFTQFETTKRGGMGLGLSICKSMIEANGGRIWYHGGLAKGAAFSFTIPVARAG